MVARHTFENVDRWLSALDRHLPGLFSHAHRKPPVGRCGRCVIGAWAALGSRQCQSRILHAAMELGQLLHYERILSGNRNIACATCHRLAFGTSDEVSLSFGDEMAGHYSENDVVKEVHQGMLDRAAGLRRRVLW